MKMPKWYYKEFEEPEGNISVSYHVFMVILSVILMALSWTGFFIGLLIMLLVIFRLIGGNKNYMILGLEFILGIFIALATGLFWWELVFGLIILLWNGVILAKHWGWL